MLASGVELSILSSRQRRECAYNRWHERRTTRETRVSDVQFWRGVFGWPPHSGDSVQPASERDIWPAFVCV